ncbi:MULTISPECIES: AAA family ATPase [unclassified Colwellia]|jgi:wobble nucleotide-excising tRNase|uniref:AAA family ATPase n=1 Tax=unclassified Colwellia TaxID=196834 RepID=UPI0015F61CCE|nr:MULTISPECIES: AAA family ATPase [unclassified Colwellia]MBA6232427.1 AAA family ATPase [Colwellia sp. MB02u-7]MBA6238284.1 AAA family ATPase [Colwellia sp. MB02u-11]MBA6301034.1 AAA family ATPase [Colwellia sp. MB3u-22]MBA6310034.1 AAA family ATPase [Colwellia sp. MB3u-64]
MTIIKRIDISNFGSYKNFKWKDTIKNDKNEVVDFKKLNILYGRNYSGKTTLSRIFRALETKNIPQDFSPCNFLLKTDSGDISHSNVVTNQLDIRVYNSDFTGQNLSFLSDNDGKINPFAILGEDNTEIERKVEEITSFLGDSEQKIGLFYQKSLKYVEYIKAKQVADNRQSELDQKLKNKANVPKIGIKYKYSLPTYNVNALAKDIKLVQNESYTELSGAEIIKLNALRQDKELDEVTKRVNLQSNFKSLYDSAKTLIESNIKPSKPIQDLLDNYLLNEWVKNGRKLHESVDTCSFCGNPLPADLWKKLDAHFDQESEDLEQKIIALTTKVNREMSLLSDDVDIEVSQLYSEYKDQFEQEKKNLKRAVKDYKINLVNINKCLQEKKEDIFSSKVIIPLVDVTENFTNIAQEINNIIDLSNQKTTSLNKEQEKAKKKLVWNEVSTFLQEIQYDDELKAIETLSEAVTVSYKKDQEIAEQIKAKEDERALLLTQLHDETKGADKVNQYLNNFFGHEGLKLEATEEAGGRAFKFEIKRGNQLAKNLSEGECSLVAFCYFMAKLEDSESQDKKLIIYIDDPISSLDSNHIFFIYSLIETLIAKPTGQNENGKNIFGYDQLFISTHNLDFLKYLKRMTKPSKAEGSEQFLISNKNTGSSIEIMPKYLRNYVTEFNYLFGEIYTCSDETNKVTHYNSFYNFGNNLRKFLEAFLFFKYPFSQDESKDHNLRVEKFFADDLGAEPLVQRIVNEFSHLSEQFDRSVEPIDHAEIARLAQFVLKKLKDNDEEQFDCLTESVNFN